MPLSPGDPSQRFAHEGRHKYLLVPADGIADKHAPTVAELTAMDVFDITRFIPKNGGITGDPTENYSDNSDQSEIFDAQQVGSFGWQPTLEFYMQDPDNNLFDYIEYGLIQYWVDIFTATEDSPEDGDKCVVALVEFHEPKPLTFATNEKQRARCGMAVLEAPAYSAVVVAS